MNKWEVLLMVAQFSLLIIVIAGASMFGVKLLAALDGLIAACPA